MLGNEEDMGNGGIPEKYRVYLLLSNSLVSD